jgi:ubiquinone/menaquinone biosynthesis C-methylase UbiE
MNDKPGLKESAEWHQAYHGAEQVRRRREQIPGKLRKLGLTGDNRDKSILDLCCGNGETLDALYTMGFRKLTGLDIAIGPDLRRDSRFSTRIGDACAPPFPDNSFDWILIVHALHHLGPASKIEGLLRECCRMLKPGGRVALVDFPNSVQIRLAFWFFRHDFWLFTPYLKYFGKLIQEEWMFLKDYLLEWRRVYKLLHHGPLLTESYSQEIFYYYLTLRKPYLDTSG